MNTGAIYNIFLWQDIAGHNIVAILKHTKTEQIALLALVQLLTIIEVR